MKRILVISTVLIITHIPIACNDDDTCGPLIPRESKVESIDVGARSPSAGATTQLQVQVTEWSYHEVAEQSRQPFSLIGRTYACVPIDPPPSQALASIQIVAERQLIVNSTTYEAGELLNELFDVMSVLQFNENAASIPAFIAAQNEDFWLFGSYYDMVLEMPTRPDELYEGSFTLTIAFEDESTFTSESPRIRIEPED